MKQTSYSLIRNFSDLGEFQSPHSICYSLREGTGGKGASLEVTYTEQGKTETRSKELLKQSLAQSKRLVQFLYENSIPMEHWEDIVEDLVIRGKARGKVK